MSTRACAARKSTRRRSKFASPKSNLAFAQEQYARSATLAAKAFASKQELDERASTFAQAQAKLDAAKAAHAQDKAGPTDEERAIAEAQVAYAEATLADIEAKLAKTTSWLPSTAS